mmetsp:Transcript_20277/g.33461  ORF Transcript_20277/g.33461 Transcript_20277/m.33461 type:complete len:218 (+) Transcript_20277:187-840(+)|eukprot:CAMPEP_0203763774 /NCGR_PEP_ID=MMETSP0098-20131031/16850_1 /ASSEMBLY_ACC=CAM_ASM_000208 /TAXON_ID=96639 /ORGANISM=" , Strain NY0313808BC1" /LENGTH=217 /DNA_ID=CAMNT_0050658983 /DNA_START=137 /DNA_END=787 /DNA_ORIENTATION=-
MAAAHNSDSEVGQFDLFEEKKHINHQLSTDIETGEYDISVEQVKAECSQLGLKRTREDEPPEGDSDFSDPGSEEAEEEAAQEDQLFSEFVRTPQKGGGSPGNGRKYVKKDENVNKTVLSESSPEHMYPFGICRTVDCSQAAGRDSYCVRHSSKSLVRNGLGTKRIQIGNFPNAGLPIKSKNDFSVCSVDGCFKPSYKYTVWCLLHNGGIRPLCIDEW